MPDLRLKLQRGDTWVQSIRQNFTEEGESEPDPVYIYEMSSIVQEFARPPIPVDQKTTFLESWLGGQRLPASKDAKPIVVLEKFGEHGERTGPYAKYEDGIEIRLDRLTWFIAPKLDDLHADGVSWSAKYGQTEDTRVPEIAYRWKYLGDSRYLGRKCAKLEVSVFESGLPKSMTGTGQAMVDVETGVMLSLSMDVKSAQLPGGEGQAYGLKLELKTNTFKRSGRELLARGL